MIISHRSKLVVQKLETLLKKAMHHEPHNPTKRSYDIYSIGIPKDSIMRYETALKSDQYLIIVHGSQEEVERAHEILATGEPTDVTIHLS